MVAKKTAVSRTASEGSTAAAAEEETASAGAETGEEKPAGKAARRTAAGKKAASRPPEPEQAGQDPAHDEPPAKKSTAKKSAARKTSKKATGAAQAAEQTGAHTVVAKKSAARSTAAEEGTATAVPPARGGVATAPADLAVRPGEDPWTPEEVEEARTELTGEVLRLRSELEASGEALAGLMRDSGDGAGDDDADTGTKNITREHELSLAAHAQETLDQTERALARLDAGTYGLCEVCGKPIGKARMQAFPRATLCVEDKQKQERRGQ
ncbi:TraR/DksA C4-type zinc finger protein [Streptomyces sp. JH34]|uniref:TraR/DksA family transcriptional regulator n=1 Tax=Streptomyces sp. JH34 TaxID=2793633 RepID=UPI0023F87FE5|nr:TraR/DksA C4-type zinc finger protein [Streptomyces sp. JH34]MDF6021661.1 TraR/DksA C4-type zinc finger protein [Streptomyces sp. JH34]